MTRRKEEEVSTSYYRTEAYVGKAASRRDASGRDKTEESDIHAYGDEESTMTRSFHGYALRTGTAKFAGKDLYERDVVKNAEGDGQIRRSRAGNNAC